MMTTNGQLLQLTHFSNLGVWSANQAVFEKRDAKFPLVPLWEILKRVREPIRVENDKRYRRITVRLYGQGILLRDEIFGKDIGTKRQFVAHTGDLIISRIDARNGAVGLVPEDLNGAIVTNDFWLFEVQDAHPRFLVLLLSSELFRRYLQNQSSGTTNRQRVSESDFLNSKIALPTMERQEDIVKQYHYYIDLASSYEEKAKKTAENIERYLFDKLGIREKEITKDNSLVKPISFSALHQWGYDKNSTPFPYTFEKYAAFSFLNKPGWVRAVFRGKSPKYRLDSSKIILNQKCNRADSIDLSFAKTVDADWLGKFDKKCLTQKDDILINSTGEGTLGRANFITEEFEGLAYDSHMLLLKINPNEVDARLIAYLMNSSFGKKQVERYKSAQATKQTELGIENLQKLLFPLPELSEQKRIANRIERKKKEVTRLKKEAEGLRQQAKRYLEDAVF